MVKHSKVKPKLCLVHLFPAGSSGPNNSSTLTVNARNGRKGDCSLALSFPGSDLGSPTGLYVLYSKQFKNQSIRQEGQLCLPSNDAHQNLQGSKAVTHKPSSPVLSRPGGSHLSGTGVTSMVGSANSFKITAECFRVDPGVDRPPTMPSQGALPPRALSYAMPSMPKHRQRAVSR